MVPDEVPVSVFSMVGRKVLVGADVGTAVSVSSCRLRTIVTVIASALFSPLPLSLWLPLPLPRSIPPPGFAPKSLAAVAVAAADITSRDCSEALPQAMARMRETAFLLRLVLWFRRTVNDFIVLVIIELISLVDNNNNNLNRKPLVTLRCVALRCVALELRFGFYRELRLNKSGFV